MTDGKEIAQPLEQPEKPQAESPQIQAAQTSPSQPDKRRALLQRLKDRFDLDRLRRNMAREIPQAPESQIKQSHNPEIQTAVDEKRQEILQKYPGANEAIANQDARNAVAQELKLARIREENQRNKAAKEEAEKDSMVDPLTGLHNRRWFDEEFQRRSAETQRLGKDLWLVTIDFDNFKQINYQYGNTPGGDTALKLISHLNTRQEEPIARIGGDEFAQFVDEDITEEGLAALLHRYTSTMTQESSALIKNFALVNNVSEEEKIKSFGLCVGFTQYLPGESEESLLHRADVALKQAKEDPGKNSGYIATVEDGEIRLKKLTPQQAPLELTPKIALPA